MVVSSKAVILVTSYNPSFPHLHVGNHSYTGITEYNIFYWIPVSNNSYCNSYVHGNAEPDPVRQRGVYWIITAAFPMLIHSLLYLPSIRISTGY